MQLNTILEDDDAVSPVIGVILMVAITVILAAVIATFVLGLGEQISDSNPQATFEFDYDAASDELTVTHTGGDTIGASELYIRGADDEGAWSDTPVSTAYSADSEINAGNSVTVGVQPGDTVRVAWETAEGGQSATLQQWDGPDA